MHNGLTQFDRPGRALLNLRRWRIRRCVGVIINVGGLVVLVSEALSLAALW